MGTLSMQHCCISKYSILCGYLVNRLESDSNSADKQMYHQLAAWASRCITCVQFTNTCTSTLHARYIADFGLAVFFDPDKVPRIDLGLEGTPWCVLACSPGVALAQLYFKAAHAGGSVDCFSHPKT